VKTMERMKVAWKPRMMTVRESERGHWQYQCDVAIAVAIGIACVVESPDLPAEWGRSVAAAGRPRRRP